MPTLPYLQIFSLVADLTIFLFVALYLLRLHKKERELKKIREKIDTEYHHIVDQALAKERKIIDDATTQASQIITSAQFINKASAERIEQALQKLAEELQKGTINTGNTYMQSYSTTLQHIAASSLQNFQTVAKGLEANLQKQSQEFNQAVHQSIEKDVAAYKQIKMKEAEQKITMIVSKVTEEILNKSISLEDQHALMIDSLEKAKKEGVFN